MNVMIIELELMNLEHHSQQDVVLNTQLHPYGAAYPTKAVKVTFTFDLKVHTVTFTFDLQSP